MPAANTTDPTAIARFVDYLYGKEGQQDAVGAVSRFVQVHHNGSRPTGGNPQHACWPNLEALKTGCRHYGPATTLADVDTAWAAFVAS